MAMTMTGELPTRIRVVDGTDRNDRGTWYEILALALAAGVLLLAVANIGAPVSTPDPLNVDNVWIIGP